MSLRAYQQTATRTENPREMEYRLFGQVTRALMTASEAPADDIATRASPRSASGSAATPAR